MWPRRRRGARVGLLLVVWSGEGVFSFSCHSLTMVLLLPSPFSVSPFYTPSNTRSYSFMASSPPARSAIAARSCFWKSSSTSSSSQLSSHSWSAPGAPAASPSATVVLCSAAGQYYCGEGGVDGRLGVPAAWPGSVTSWSNDHDNEQLARHCETAPTLILILIPQ
jgi:hypothetical protein